MKKWIIAGLFVVFTGVLFADDLIGGKITTTDASATNVLLGSVAQGSVSNQASGTYSHAEGLGTIAAGAAAHAEGAATVAGGAYAHAEGVGTRAGGYASHAAGTYANATNDYTYVWSDGTVTGSTTSNQFTVHAANGIRLLGGPITGNGSGLSNLNAGAISSGSISADRLPTSGTWNAAGVTVSNLTVSGAGISGDVAAMPNLTLGSAPLAQAITNKADTTNAMLKSVYVASNPNNSNKVDRALVADRLYQAPVTDFTWTTNNGQITLTSVIGTNRSLVIPDTINGLPVVAFGDIVASYNSCADNLDYVTDVVIGANITSIEDFAFYDCEALASVTIGNSVISIGDHAFNCCYALTSITIPNSVTSIGNYAFASCTAMTNAVIGNAVTTFGVVGAFVDCLSLSSIIIPASVTNIGANTFERDETLTSITFLGDAPAPPGSSWSDFSGLTNIYRTCGATGWGSTYGGLPVMLTPEYATSLVDTSSSFTAGAVLAIAQSVVNIEGDISTLVDVKNSMVSIAGYYDAPYDTMLNGRPSYADIESGGGSTYVAFDGTKWFIQGDVFATNSATSFLPPLTNWYLVAGSDPSIKFFSGTDAQQQTQIDSLNAKSNLWNTVTAKASQTDLNSVSGRVASLEGSTSTWNTVTAKANITDLATLSSSVAADVTAVKGQISSVSNRVTAIEASSGIWNSAYSISTNSQNRITNIESASTNYVSTAQFAAGTSNLLNKTAGYNELSGVLVATTNVAIRGQVIVGSPVFVQQIVSNAVTGALIVDGVIRGDGSGLTNLNLTGLIPTNQPVAWGAITGTLSSQTDLASALAAKANSNSLANVATSGSYSDLNGQPSLAAIATNANFSNLTVADGAIAQAKVNGLTNALADKLNTSWTNSLGTMAYAATSNYISTAQFAAGTSNLLNKTAGYNELSGVLVATTNVAIRGQVIVGSPVFAQQIVSNAVTGALIVDGVIRGDGSGLTNLNVSLLSGKIPATSLPTSGSWDVSGIIFSNLNVQGSSQGDLDMGGHKIVNLGAAVSDDSAASQGRVKTMMQQVPEYGDLSMGEFTSQVATPDRPVPTVIHTEDMANGAVTLNKMGEIAGRTVVGNMSGGFATPTAIEVKDEDDMASNSDTAIPTQQSVKTYVDALRDAISGGDINFGGALQSSNFQAGVSGWRVSSDGVAEFNNIKIRNDVAMPQVFYNAQQITNGATYTFMMDSVTLTISMQAGCSARYTTDGTLPDLASSASVPPGGKITVSGKKLLRVVSFETATGRSSPVFSADFRTYLPMMCTGLGTLAIRTYLQFGGGGDYVSWATGGTATSPPDWSSFTNENVKASTYHNAQGVPDGLVWNTGVAYNTPVWFAVGYVNPYLLSSVTFYRYDGSNRKLTLYTQGQGGFRIISIVRNSVGDFPDCFN